MFRSASSRVCKARLKAPAAPPTRQPSTHIQRSNFASKATASPAAAEQQHSNADTKGSGNEEQQAANNQASQPQQPRRKKTAAEMDEELRMRMESLAGDGGAAGVEYEDGQPVAMKRGVKANMFRYI